jgi:hypothetical protein
MYGPTIGSLRVYLNSSGQTVQHWVKYGDQGNKWQKTIIGIGKQNNPFRIIIEGELQRKLKMFMGFDFLVLYKM